MEAIHVVAKKYQQLGKTVHLIHLSQACRQMLRKAKALISISFAEEPQFHLVTDRYASKGSLNAK